MNAQLSLFCADDYMASPEEYQPDLASYDYIIVATSGGKDSLACLLYLLSLGIDARKLELMHHCVDGQGENFMDWPCTPGYVRALAEHFKIPLYFSWRAGGFKQELLRANTPTAPVYFQTPDGLKVAGGEGKPNTRRKFPQQSASLKTRWCSSVLKIDVCAIAIRNQERFLGKRTLIITGERAIESAARSRYSQFQAHSTNTKSRHIDHWRPLLYWTTEEVWAIIKNWGIVPHPAYWLGFGRTSCAFCIFLGDKDLRVLQEIALNRFTEIEALEKEFELTISRERLGIRFRAQRSPLRSLDNYWVEAATGKDWFLPIAVSPLLWQIPPGAFADLNGGSP